MKIINNVDDFKSLKSIDLEDIKTTKIILENVTVLYFHIIGTKL